MKLLILLLMCVILLPKLHKASDNITNNGINDTRSQDMLGCCVSESCACHSFVDMPVNITSTNVTNILVYMTSDMVLSSVTHLTHLKNISIIGYNNPTVQCGYSGGLHFVSCHNVTIEGITWNQCGTDANVSMVGLYVYNSSNINIQDCTFWNSQSQSIVLIRNIRKCEH